MSHACAVTVRCPGPDGSCQTCVTVSRSRLVKGSPVFAQILNNASSGGSQENGDGNCSTNCNSNDRETILVDVNGFVSEAVRLVFELVNGYHFLMKDCHDIKVLTDMILLCDFYQMPQFKEAISAQFESCKISMQNLISTMQIVEKHETNQLFKPVAAQLEEWCYSVFLNNMTSAGKLVNFVSQNTNRDTASIVARLCRQLELKRELKPDDWDTTVLKGDQGEAEAGSQTKDRTKREIFKELQDTLKQLHEGANKRIDEAERRVAAAEKRIRKAERRANEARKKASKMEAARRWAETRLDILRRHWE